MQDTHDLAPRDSVLAILEELREHTNGAPLQHDDVSLLLIEFVDNLASPALWTALQNRLFRRRRENKIIKAPVSASS